MSQTHEPVGTRSRLELELMRVRAEAARIRLQARAAELEQRAAEIELLLLAGNRRPDSAAAGGAEHEPLHMTEPPDGQMDGFAAVMLQQARGEASTAVARDSATSTPEDSGRHPSLHTGVQSRHDAAEALLRAIGELVAGTHPSDGSAGSEWGRVGPAASSETWQQRLDALQRRETNVDVSEQRTRPEPHAGNGAAGVVSTASQDDADAMGSRDVPRLESTELRGPVKTLRLEAGSGSAESDATGSDATKSDATESDTAGSDAAATAGIDIKAAEQQAAEAQSQFLPGTANGSQQTKLRKAPARKLRGAARPIDLPLSITLKEAPRPPGDCAGAIEVNAREDVEPQRKQIRPAAWLVSTTAHLAVLVVLGLMTLSTQRPRDQLAFSASVAEASEEVMETFTIEVSETPLEEAQTKPEDTVLEVSPIGTVPLADLSLDLPDAPPGPLASELLSSTRSLTSLKAAGGDTLAKVSFAGVEGGGNHFVYLVDSSNSMRNFNEARLELLRSIDSLESHQRFYVVFYDQEPDYMRLTDRGSDEPASVLATPDNKAALRRWAMAIQQERGKSPIDVLQFAFKLRPDVIFLLSDGEFSARTEVVIREHNRQENLFGEAGPISIIHTIRYPGFSAAEARNAEVQMKRIAAENGGQYRAVQIP